MTDKRRMPAPAGTPATTTHPDSSRCPDLNVVDSDKAKARLLNRQIRRAIADGATRRAESLLGAAQLTAAHTALGHRDWRSYVKSLEGVQEAGKLDNQIE